MSAHFILPPGNVQIAFSGGRTSGKMLHDIAEANGGLPDRCRVIFTNTGREFPQTLDFVAECGHRWNVAIEWVEYRPAPQRFAVVGHNSASRDGAPFRELIERRKFLPNALARFCTTELKIRPASAYLRSLGWENWQVALGIRADEPSRLHRQRQRERWQPFYPLADAGVTKESVADFWRGQSFDLRLPAVNGKTSYGNCDGCFLKSEAFLARLSVTHPARAAWWEDMEELVSSLTNSPAATFSKRYSRRRLHEFASRQGDALDELEATGGLCHADDGECAA